MEEICPYETLASTYKSIWCNCPEDEHPHLDYVIENDLDYKI
jgi:hypothetical protein